MLLVCFSFDKPENIKRVRMGKKLENTQEIGIVYNSVFTTIGGTPAEKEMENTPKGRNGENIKNKTPKRLSIYKSYKLKLSAHARSNSKILGTKYRLVNIDS